MSYKDVKLETVPEFAQWLEREVSYPSCHWRTDRPIKYRLEHVQWGHGDREVDYWKLVTDGDTDYTYQIPDSIGNLLDQAWTKKQDPWGYKHEMIPTGYVLPKTILKRLREAKGDPDYLETVIQDYQAKRERAEAQARKENLAIRQERIMEKARALVQEVTDDRNRYLNESPSQYGNTSRERSISYGQVAYDYSDLFDLVREAISELEV